MKKLIAISVVFALVAGAVFAVDVGATVIGTVNVLQGNTGKDGNGDANPVTGGGKLNRVRLDGSGEAGENFGGYFRFDRHHWNGELAFTGNVWWKPVDQLKLQIGGNDGDGYLGKEGVTGWGFYQTVTDTDVSFGGDNAWGGSIYGAGITTRNAFYGGGKDGAEDLYLFITPMDILGINIQLPFLSESGAEVADVFKKTIAQIDVKIEGVGNIALTYRGGLGYSEGDKTYIPATDSGKGTVITDEKGDKWYLNNTGVATKITDATGGKAPHDDPASIFVYYGGSFGDLSVDFGLGYTLANHYGADDAKVKAGDKKAGDAGKANPIGIGLGVKYATDAFGVKFRTVAALAGDDESTRILADVMPFFSLGDNLTAYVSIGLGMLMPKEGDSLTGWHFNPYLVVGEEWGAKFLVGIKAWSPFKSWNDTEKKFNDAVTYWAVPIAMCVSF